MAKKDVKVYEIDDIQNGYNHQSKLRNIYFDLKKQLLTEKPIQVSPISDSTDSLQLIDDWEVYHLQNKNVIMLEYKGGFTHYTAQSKQRLREDDVLTFIKITVHPITQQIQEAIEEIISKYPREPNPKVEMF